MFGHEKGAFTGANARSIGRFEQAEGGTLFLDEIGDMPMEAQTRLLRVLQQGEYTTVGGRTPIKTNVRIIAATNKDLRYSIQQGLFREDLFFRLNVVPLRLPPLRERTEDIPDLVRHFFQRGVAEGLSAKSLDHAALDRLKRYPWPGNIRELENLARRLAALYPQEVVTESLIEAELSFAAPMQSLGPSASNGAELGGRFARPRDGERTVLLRTRAPCERLVPLVRRFAAARRALSSPVTRVGGALARRDPVGHPRQPDQGRGNFGSEPKHAPQENSGP